MKNQLIIAKTESDGLSFEARTQTVLPIEIFKLELITLLLVTLLYTRVTVGSTPKRNKSGHLSKKMGLKIINKAIIFPAVIGITRRVH